MSPSLLVIVDVLLVILDVLLVILYVLLVILNVLLVILDVLMVIIDFPFVIVNVLLVNSLISGKPYLAGFIMARYPACWISGTFL